MLPVPLNTFKSTISNTVLHKKKNKKSIYCPKESARCTMQFFQPYVWEVKKTPSALSSKTANYNVLTSAWLSIFNYWVIRASWFISSVLFSWRGHSTSSVIVKKSLMWMGKQGISLTDKTQENSVLKSCELQYHIIRAQCEHSFHILLSFFFAERCVTFSQKYTILMKSW